MWTWRKDRKSVQTGVPQVQATDIMNLRHAHYHASRAPTLDLREQITRSKNFYWFIHLLICNKFLPQLSPFFDTFVREVCDNKRTSLASFSGWKRRRGPDCHLRANNSTILRSLLIKSACFPVRTQLDLHPAVFPKVSNRFPSWYDTRTSKWIQSHVANPVNSYLLSKRTRGQ